jgi:hypothetical protein
MEEELLPEGPAAEDVEQEDEPDSCIVRVGEPEVPSLSEPIPEPSG